MKLTQVATWLLTADVLTEEARASQLAELLSKVAETVRVTKWNITQEVKRGDLPARMAQPILNDILLDLQQVTAPELQSARDTLIDYIRQDRVEEGIAEQVAQLLGARAPRYTRIKSIETRAPLFYADEYY
jgi:hypothetical protein